MTAMTHNMTDKELDQILHQVRQPVLPEGFAARLQQKLETAKDDNVVAFPQRKPAPTIPRRFWLSAIPLAASLVFGLYLGAAGIQLATSDDAEEASLGIEDTESFLNGEPT
jgi:hypothetical protein